MNLRSRGRGLFVHLASGLCSPCVAGIQPRSARSEMVPPTAWNAWDIDPGDGCSDVREYTRHIRWCVDWPAKIWHTKFLAVKCRSARVPTVTNSRVHDDRKPPTSFE